MEALLKFVDCKTFSRLTLPRGQIFDWPFPVGHVPNVHFPDWAISGLDISQTKISPTGYFPDHNTLLQFPIVLFFVKSQVIYLTQKADFITQKPV